MKTDPKMILDLILFNLIYIYNIYIIKVFYDFKAGSESGSVRGTFPQVALSAEGWPLGGAHRHSRVWGCPDIV